MFGLIIEHLTDEINKVNNFPKGVWEEGVTANCGKSAKESYANHLERPAYPDSEEEFYDKIYQMQTQTLIYGKKSGKFLNYIAFLIEKMQLLGSYYENEDRGYFFGVHIGYYFLGLFFMYVIHIFHLVWIEKYYFSYGKRRRKRFIKFMQDAEKEYKGIPEYSAYASTIIFDLQDTENLKATDYMYIQRSTTRLIERLRDLQKLSIEYNYIGTTTEVASFLKHTLELNIFIRLIYWGKYYKKIELGYPILRQYVTNQEVEDVA